MSKKRNGILPPVVILRNVSDEESLWKYEVFNMKNREGRFFDSRMLAQNDRAGFEVIKIKGRFFGSCALAQNDRMGKWPKGMNGRAGGNIKGEVTKKYFTSPEKIRFLFP
jgi:hypothetical protein